MEDTDLSWRTSSYSSNGGGECVEVGNGDHVLVRDTKNPAGPALAFTPASWQAFTRRIQAR
jgi:Domain of unknown function (DUF397)